MEKRALLITCLVLLICTKDMMARNLKTSYKKKHVLFQTRNVNPCDLLGESCTSNDDCPGSCAGRNLFCYHNEICAEEVWDPYKKKRGIQRSMDNE
ncbi:unnamed protein product [Porites evermanni]|uniref:Uncharacterized protein n=1 Tax=Porites evermanni TaxID=104178 RepID=A0ABN8LKI1_9CNID|nr:unnamed protein product [Porites evermanni]